MIFKRFWDRRHYLAGLGEINMAMLLPSIFAGVLVAGVAISILTFGVASLF